MTSSQERRLRALDLFCCAGGASMGLRRAGFDVVGVDIAPQPRYPFEFHQADALTFPLDGFDFYWASPPCQQFCALRTREDLSAYPDLIDPIRQRLLATGKPFVIENVVGAPVRKDLLLCGAMFGLRSYRHRLFECSFPIAQPIHRKHLVRVNRRGENRRQHLGKRRVHHDHRRCRHVLRPRGNGHRLDERRRDVRGNPAGLRRIHRKGRSMSATSHTTMFRSRPECGDRDLDLPGSRYFSVGTDDSRLTGWVSEQEYRALCKAFGIDPPEKPEPPAIESVAYDTKSKPLRGFSVRGSYLKGSQQALIEISKNDKVVRSFEYPAYRIWNIPAHFEEYIDGLDADGRPEAQSDEKEVAP